MSKTVSVMLALCLIAVCCTSGSTASGEADDAADLRQKELADFYGFGPMQIVKLDWGIENLLAGDFNNDGLNDMAVANNARSRIELLMQRPAEAEDEIAVAVDPADTDTNELTGFSRFKREDLAVAQRIFSMACGDLNSDGLTDIAFYGEPAGLYVLLRKKDEKDGSLGWQNPRKIKVEDGLKSRLALICADLNQDGRADLALAGQDTVHVAFQQSDGSVAEPTGYPTTASPFAIKSGDLNGDGLRDMILAVSDNDRPLQVRFGLPGGRLGPQRDFDIDKPLLHSLCIADYDGDDRDELLMIDGASRRMNCYRLSETPAGDAEECSTVVYPLEANKESAKRDLVMADVDGDGLSDVVVSDPAAAEVILYRQIKGIGLDQPETFPSVAGITTLAAKDIDGDGKDEIAVLSVVEKTLGISRHAEGRLSFPSALAVGGEPVAMDIGDVDGDGKADCVYVVKDSNDVRVFGVIANSQLLASGGDAVPQVTLALKQLQANPDGIKVLDANRDGLADVLILVQWESPVLLLQNPAGVFNQISPEGSRAGLLKDATMRSLSLMDTDTGPAQLLVAQKNFARTMAVDPSGKWQIVDQFNARSSENAIAAAAAFDIDGDSTAEILLLDGTKGQLQILKVSEDKTYRLAKELTVGKWGIKKVLFGLLGGGDVKDIVLFDGAKFALVAPPGRPGSMLKAQRNFSYETRIKDGRYGNLATGDINSDGRCDLIAVDTQGDHMEILAVDADGMPLPAMRFKIMEQKSYGDRQPRDTIEPRELMTADVTGDGRNDLITVIHDRLIVYPQD